MAKFVHLEIHSNNIDRTKDFFVNVFGWDFDRWGGPKNYWLLKTGSNEDSTKITILEKESDFAGVINTIEVPSIEQTLKLVTKNGGKILLKKTPIENTGYIAYFADIDKNVFGLVQKDTFAK